MKALRPGRHFYLLTIMQIGKKDLATLIDAYADAKASRNQHLVNSMVSQLEQALDSIFPSEPEASEIAE